MASSGRDLFPRAAGRAKGYAPEQVETFLLRAQAWLHRDPGAAPVSVDDVRRVGFDLVRRGYEVTAVDEALDALEVRLLDDALARDGSQRVATVLAAAHRLAAELQGPRGARFPRTSRLRSGYARSEVDDLVDRLLPLLVDAGADPAGGVGVAAGAPLDVAAVREAVFHPRRGGYDETAVDDALDQVVDVLLRRERALRDVPAAHPPRHA